jgi:hypothetical protein
MGRLIGMTCTLSAIVAGMIVLTPLAVDAGTIATFDNSRYVDTTSAPGEAESDNVRASTKSVGHTVRRFTGIDATSLTQAVDNADALLIPELELGDLAVDLDVEARAVIVNYVADGGGIVINGTSGLRAADLLNELFGWSVTSGSVGAGTRTAAAAGTEFADVPDTLPAHTRTRGLDVASLPEEAVVLYEQGNLAPRAPIVRFSHGNGRVIYLGWDWFEAKPLGREDGGWVRALGAAYEEIFICRDTSRGDLDGDGIANECDEIEPVQRCQDVDGQRDLNIAPKIAVKKIGADTDPDNDGLTIHGEFLLPVGSGFNDLDPRLRPVGVILESDDGMELVTVTLPMLTYTGPGTAGWSRTGAGKWLYVDETSSPTDGVVEASIKNRSGSAPRQIRVKLVARNGSIPVESGDEPLRAMVVVGDPAAGECATTTFNRPDCTFGTAGRRLTCQK